MDLVTLFKDTLLEDAPGAARASSCDGAAGGCLPLHNATFTPGHTASAQPRPAAVDLCSLQVVRDGLPLLAGGPVPGGIPQGRPCADSKRLLVKAQNRAKQARYRERLKVRHVSLAHTVFQDVFVLVGCLVAPSASLK